MRNKIRFRLTGRKAFLEDMYFHDELKQALSFTSPGARFSPAYNRFDENGKRLWDGKVSMVKNGMLPVGLLIGAQDEIRKAGFKLKVVGWENRPKVKLKKGWVETDKIYAEHQNKAVEAMLASLNKGGGTMLSATGTGKTKTAAQFFSWIDDDCLFVVDQVNLLYQSQKELGFWLKEKVGVVGNSKFDLGRVTVATIQTLQARQKDKLFKKWFKGIKVMFIDELHKQMSKRNFKILEVIQPEAVFGLTATLQMKQTQVRWKVFSITGPIIFEFPIEDAIARGVVSKGVVVQVTVPEPDEKRTARYVNMMLAEYKDKHADRVIKPEELRRVIQRFKYDANVTRNDKANKIIHQVVVEALRQGEAVAVLAQRLPHIASLKKLMKSLDPQVVQGSVKKKEREKIIRQFEKGKKNLILASAVFTKGVNIRRISLVIDAAQRPNPDDAMQKLGRGVRKHEIKKLGLRYIDMKTKNSMEAAGKKRKNTFKRAHIPVAEFEWADETKNNAKKVLELGTQLLQQKKGK